MAFSTREVAYVATVQGFDKAEQAIEGADGAIDDAAGSAERAARSFAQAEAAAAGMGDGIKSAGDGAKAGAGAIEAFEKRVAFASKVLSGFGLMAIPGAVTALIDLGTRLYEATDAGKAAAAATEAHNAALQATLDLLTGVSDASRVATADLVAYYRVRKAAETIEVELNELLERRLQLDSQLRNARLGGDVNAQRKYRDAIEDTDRQLARLKDRLTEVTAEQRALTDAVEDAGAAMTGQPLELLREGVKKAGDQVRAEAERIKREAEAAAKALRESIARQLDLAGAIDLDNLPPLELDVDIKPIDAGQLTAELLDGEREASFEATRLALERRKAAIEAAEALKAEVDAAAAATGGLVAAWHAVAAAEREGEAGARAWADAVKTAATEVSGALGAVRAAFDAITEAELTGIRNKQLAADEDLRSAQAAERRAQAEAEANASSIEARQAAAAAAKVREKAEEKSYRAALAAAQAEEDAAAARQIWAAIDMAAKGAESAADAVRAGALAAFLAALPFGVGAPFVPAATTSAVLYGVAAAAYGVGAVAVGTAPTPKSARPEKPDSMLPDASKETVASGNRERSTAGGVTNQYFSFGSVLGTTAEAEDAVVRAIERAGERRGGARVDISRVDSGGWR